MAELKKPAKPTPQKPDGDVFLTVLYPPDREALALLLRKEMLDLGPVQSRPDGELLEVHIYATKEQIKLLKECGWKLDVRQNLSEIGRKRQEEVGKGDRFEGGKITPKGLGRKTRKED